MAGIVKASFHWVPDQNTPNAKPPSPTILKVSSNAHWDYHKRDINDYPPIQMPGGPRQIATTAKWRTLLHPYTSCQTSQGARGSASDGWGDAEQNNDAYATADFYGTSQGTHLVTVDGSSGDFTYTAPLCQAEVHYVDGYLSYNSPGAQGAVSFSVSVSLDNREVWLTRAGALWEKRSSSEGANTTTGDTIFSSWHKV